MPSIRSYWVIAFMLMGVLAAPAQDRPRYVPQRQSFWQSHFGGQFSAPPAPEFPLEDGAPLAHTITNGKLLLTPQDAIYFAARNNIDLQVERYGSYASAWGVEKSQAAFEPSHTFS